MVWNNARESMRILYLLAIICLCSPVYGMRTPMMISASPSVSATNFAGFGSTSFLATNDTIAKTIIATDGNIEGIYVTLTAAPGSGKSFTFTLRKNSVDTTIACTVSDTATSCSNEGILSVVATDYVSIKSVPSGTPATSTSKISTIFNSFSNGPALIYSSSNANPSSSQTVALLGNLPWAQSGTYTSIPTAGTLSKLYVATSVAPGAAASGKAITVTINKNGVGTSLTCTVLETATSCNDLSNSFSVVAGNNVSLSYAITNAPTTGSIYIGMVFTPTIDGESIQSFSYGGGAPSATVNNFIRPNVNGSGYSTSDTYMIMPVDNVIAKKIRFISAGGPGSGKSMIAYLRQNSVSTALTCTLTGQFTTSCNDIINSVTLSAGDTIGFLLSPSNTPVVWTANYLSMVLYIDPTEKIFNGVLYDSKIY